MQKIKCKGCKKVYKIAEIYKEFRVASRETFYRVSEPYIVKITWKKEDAAPEVDAIMGSKSYIYCEQCFENSTYNQLL